MQTRLGLGTRSLGTCARWDQDMTGKSARPTLTGKSVRPTLTGKSVRPWARRSRGFSLLECTVSVMLVGILMTAALRSLSTMHLRTGLALERMQGKQLCEAYCREALSKSFADPSSGKTSWGLEAGENLMLRSSLDDVDDYVNLNLSPPTNPRAQTLDGFAGWRVTVEVSWADPATLLPTHLTTTNLKRIVVQAFAGNRLVYSTTGYRAADDY